MATKAERYAEKQRRAAARRGGNPKRSKKAKRRKKMERRRDGGWSWDSGYCDFTVQIELPSIDLNLQVSARNPDEAAKLALFEQRDFLLKRADGTGIPVVVQHAHRGEVARDEYVIPDDDGFLPKPKVMAKHERPKRVAMSVPQVFAALARAKHKQEIKRAQEREDSFKVKDKGPGDKFPGI